MPFLLSADPLHTIYSPNFVWVDWNSATQHPQGPSFTLEDNLTKKLRCSLGVGGAC